MSEEKRFRLYSNNLTDLLSLAEIEISSNPQFKELGFSTYLSIGKGIVRNLDDKTLITKFISQTSAYWKNLYSKDDELLIESSENMLKIIPLITIKKETIRKILNSGCVDVKTKENIWITLHRMIRVSLKYLIRCSSENKNFSLPSGFEEECDRWGC